MATERKSTTKKTSAKKSTTKKPTAKKTSTTRKKNTTESIPQIDRQRESPVQPKGVPRSEKQASSEYQPKHTLLQNAGLDQNAAERDRVKARAAQRDQHNNRVGDASL